MRRLMLLFISCVCSIVFTFGLSVLQAEGQDPPNIIWLMTEDISTDLDTYGIVGVETPNLNTLAYQGIKYTNDFSTSSICSPNRWVMMLGPTRI